MALPAHVVAHDQTLWLGHSPLVAAKHYLQTRDAHFEVAIRGGAATCMTRADSSTALRP